MKNLSKILAAAVIGSGILGLESCKKYDDGPGFSLLSKKGRLTGEWDLTGGNVADDNDDRYNVWELIFEFQKDGDFEMRSSYSGTWYGPYESKGEWSWVHNKERINIEWDDGGSFELHINRLTNKEFWCETGYGDHFEFDAN